MANVITTFAAAAKYGRVNLLTCACACVDQPCSAESTYEAQPFHLMASKHKQTQRNNKTHKNPKCRPQLWVIMTELRACDLQRLALLLIMADGWAQNTSKSGASASISMCLTSAAAPPPQIWEDSCVTDEQNHTNENATRTTVVNVYFQAICFWVLLCPCHAVKIQSGAMIWTFTAHINTQFTEHLQAVCMNKSSNVRDLTFC